MGYTVRTDQYRYTEWVSFDPVRGEPNWNVSFGRELYQYDPPVTGGTFNDDNVRSHLNHTFRDSKQGSHSHPAW